MLYNIWLSELRHPLSKKKEWLFTHKNAENVYRALEEKGYLFESELSLEAAKRILEDCDRKKVQIHLLSEFDIPDYGELPFLLYCKGVVKKTAGAVGIVGARRCTPYGRRCTESLAAECAKNNITVVSGMAKGVDSIAHTTALKNQGYTIAALGNGPDICFPAEHQGLYEEICENGLIISEYRPGIHASRFTFPLRNRLIAAFSDKVVVTEAGRRSGALITCERAKHYGKTVYAFPGQVDSPESEGCNNLIYEGNARLFKRNDLFCEATQLSFPDTLLSASCKASEDKNSLPSQILNYLKNHRKTAEITELASVLSLDNGRIYTLLTEMELEDLIRIEGENVWLQ